MKLMGNVYPRKKAEVCYKGVCAKVYDRHADFIAAAVFIAILAFAANQIAKLK